MSSGRGKGDGKEGEVRSMIGGQCDGAKGTKGVGKVRGESSLLVYRMCDRESK